VEQVRTHLLDAMSREQFLALGRAMQQVASALDPKGLHRV
jgi:hypothetical protein